MGEGAVTIRDAGADDLAFVAGLARTAFSEFGDYEGTIALFFLEDGILTWIAEAAGTPVGFAMLDVSGEPADLVAVAVDERWRRLGAGRLLLRRAEAEAGARGGPEAAMRLTVAVDNEAARSLFESEGFEREGASHGVYPTGRLSLGMRKRVGARRG